jgi:hypothetical protein
MPLGILILLSLIPTKNNASLKIYSCKDVTLKQQAVFSYRDHAHVYPKAQKAD